MRFLTQGWLWPLRASIFDSEWQNTLNFSINSYIELTLNIGVMSKWSGSFGADSGETTRQLLTQTVKHQRSSYIDCTGDVSRNCFRNHSAILVCRLLVCRPLCFLYYFCLFEKIIGEMFGGWNYLMYFCNAIEKRLRHYGRLAQLV